MTIQSVTFSAVASFQPQTIKGFDCDGVVDGSPVVLTRNKRGGLVPAIGSVLPTPYGDARVVAYHDGSLRMQVVAFSTDYEVEIFEIKNGERYVADVLDAREHVATLSAAANRQLACLISDTYRLQASEYTGNLPKRVQEWVDSLEAFKPNEFIMDLAVGAELPDSVEVLAKPVKTERETTEERKARRALEVAEAKRLRRKLLAAYDAECPEDIAAEIAGEFDDEIDEVEMFEAPAAPDDLDF